MKGTKGKRKGREREIGRMRWRMWRRRRGMLIRLLIGLGRRLLRISKP